MSKGNKPRLLARTWFVLGAIYIVALLARLAAVYFLAWNRGLHYETVQIARFIIAGQGYSWDWYGQIPPQPTAILAPLYTYFIAFFMACFSDPARWIYVAQAILNALGVFPVYHVGRVLGGRTNGLVAAALYALLPEIVYMPTKMVAETLAIVPAMLAIYLYFNYKSAMLAREKVTGYLFLGLLLGVTTLIKDSIAFLFLAMFLSVLLTKCRRATLLKAAFLLGLGFSVAVSPWFIRNAVVMKKPVFRTMFGFNLWRGNHPWGSGTGRLDPDSYSEEMLDPQYREYIRTNHPMTELELDDFYKNEAVRFIKANPKRYARLTLKRIFYFFAIDPTHPLTRNIFYLGGHVFLLVFGTWGGVLLYRRRQLDPALLLAPLIFMAFYVPVIMLPRYRMMLVWMLLILASVSLASLLQRSGRFSQFVSQMQKPD